jgi:hypothetical protein
MAVGIRDAVGTGLGEEQDERKKRTERRDMRAACRDLEWRRGRRMERIVNENHAPVCRGLRGEQEMVGAYGERRVHRVLIYTIPNML